VLPQLATETTARAPEPWSVIHDPGCSIPGIVCTEHGSRAAAPGPRGAFEGARVMRTWGLHWDWLERDPNSRIFSQVSMLLRRSGTIVAIAAVENLPALPIGNPTRKRPEISHGGCHMVARKKWPIRGFL